MPYCMLLMVRQGAAYRGTPASPCPTVSPCGVLPCYLPSLDTQGGLRILLPPGT